MTRTGLMTVTTIAALVASLAWSASASARPDLSVVSVAPVQVRVTEGASFALKLDAVRNGGRTPAPSSVVRYYLSRNLKQSLRERRGSRLHPRMAHSDVLLGGFRNVERLAVGATSRTPRRRPVRITVPLGTAAGTYTLLACADDRGTIVERNETDNCRAARGVVRVSARTTSAVFRTLGDLRPPDTTDETLYELDEWKQQCRRSPMPRPMSLSTALSGIDRNLRRAYGAKAVNRLETRAGRTPASAQRLAGAASVGRAPAAGLIAMIRAHELEPREASHLVGAAALATTVGMPREALALLDAAARLDDRRPGALGFSNEAISLTNRGAALLAAGRPADAERVLEAALEKEPLMSEAARSLSFAAVCLGKDDKARTWYKRSRRRTPERPAHPLDTTRGPSSELRKLPLPTSVREAASLLPTYQEITNRRGSEIQEISSRKVAYGMQLSSLTPRQELATTLAQLWIDIEASRLVMEPETRVLSDAFNARIAEARGIHAQTFCLITTNDCGENDVYVAIRPCSDLGDGKHQCQVERCVPVLKRNNAAFLAKMREVQAAADTYFAATSRIHASAAAQQGHPLAHARSLLEITSQEQLLYGVMADVAQRWSEDVQRREDWCIDVQDTAAAPAAPGAPAVLDLGPCPPAIAALNFVLDLDWVVVKANCTDISAEVSAGAPFLAGFAEGKYNYQKGQLTVTAGSKGSIGLGPKVEFKSGLYVTIGSTGVTDTGWRIGPSSNAGAGVIEYSGPSDEIDLSLIVAYP